LSTQKKIANAASERLSSFQAKQTLEAAKASRRKSDNRLAIMFGAGAIVLALVGQLAYFSFGPGSVTDTESDSTEAPTVENSEMVPDAALAESRLWTGSMKVGEANLELELDGVNAPQAVANFISLSQSGFYDGVSCHRLVTDGIYVLQCGDPDGTGSGGPGYNFGPIENAPADNSYLTGSLAMARVGGNGNSMGSQFFIVYKDSRIPSDDAGGYTVFGKITSGLEDLDPVISAGVQDGASDGPPALETLLSSIELR
jgi:peptidyl-prolyl cis-trans isomerase B (cyclophilin B)